MSRLTLKLNKVIKLLLCNLTNIGLGQWFCSSARRAVDSSDDEICQVHSVKKENGPESIMMNPLY